jgi:hypothetical protein
MPAARRLLPQNTSRSGFKVLRAVAAGTPHHSASAPGPWQENGGARPERGRDHSFFDVHPRRGRSGAVRIPDLRLREADQLRPPEPARSSLLAVQASGSGASSGETWPRCGCSTGASAAATSPTSTVAIRLITLSPVCDRSQSSASSHNWEQAACQPSRGWLRGDRDVVAGNEPPTPSAL